MRSRTLLIDTQNMINISIRSTFGKELPSLDEAKSSVNNFVASLVKALGAKKVVFCLDSKPYLRSEIFKNYKANRSRDEEMSKLVSEVLEYLVSIDVENRAYPGYEADDIIATLCKIHREDMNLVICSCDKDLKQLMIEYPEINYWNLLKWNWEHKPKLDWRTFLALTGDQSDNIPSITGEKTATAILNGESLRGITGLEDLLSRDYTPKTCDDKENIPKTNREAYLRNLKLVSLTGRFSPPSPPIKPLKEEEDCLPEEFVNKDSRQSSWKSRQQASNNSWHTIPGYPYEEK